MNEWIKCSETTPPFADYHNSKKYRIWSGFEQHAYWYRNDWISNPDDSFPVTYDPTYWQEIIGPNEKEKG